MRLALWVVCAAGCDKLLGLSPLSPSNAGTAADAEVDSPAQGCTLTMMTQINTYNSPPNTAEMALFASASDAMVVMGDLRIYHRPSISTMQTDGPIFQPLASHPVVTPDGSTLYFHSIAAGGIYMSIDGDGDRLNGWTSPDPGDTPPGQYPGTPSATGTMVVVSSTGDFVEFAHGPAGWMEKSNYPAAALGFGGSIDYPALTSDGRVLVYRVTGSSGKDGIWGVTRSDESESFSGATATQLTPMPLTSPYLSESCVRLYGLDAAGNIALWSQ